MEGVVAYSFFVSGQQNRTLFFSAVIFLTFPYILIVVYGKLKLCHKVLLWKSTMNMLSVVTMHY